MESGTFLVSILTELRPILQVGFGAAIGFFAARWYHRDLLRQLQSAQFAVQVANREVQGVAATLSGQVGEHRQQVEAIQAKLATNNPPVETLSATAAELTAANERLQSGLASAKEQLVKHEHPAPEGAAAPRTDSVTFLLNAKPFEENLDRFLTRKRTTDQGSLLLISLGPQAAANETKPIKDDALREIARLISRSMNGLDAITSRYGPQEFSVLLCSASLAQAQKCACDIRSAIEQLHLTSEAGNAITASVGLSFAEPQDGTGADVRGRARAACDAAIAAGGNCSYRHDGQSCVRLEVPPPPAAEMPPASETTVAQASVPVANQPPAKTKPATSKPNGQAVLDDHEPYIEKRAHERRKCEASYEIAPYWGGKLPTLEMFFSAQFADISPGGCAILLSEPPPYKAFVVALNKPDGVIYLSANIVNVRKYNKPDSTGRPQYAIGCKFKGRVQLPTSRRAAATEMASAR